MFGVPEKKHQRPKKLLLTTTAAAVALGAAGAAAWLLSLVQVDVLDQQALQEGVATVLRDNYGEYGINNVQCPSNQEIATGHTFECSIEIGSRKAAVPIRILNGKPEYEVGAPR